MRGRRMRARQLCRRRGVPLQHRLDRPAVQHDPRICQRHGDRGNPRSDACPDARTDSAQLDLGLRRADRSRLRPQRGGRFGKSGHGLRCDGGGLDAPQRPVRRARRRRHLLQRRVRRGERRQLHVRGRLRGSERRRDLVPCDIGRLLHVRPRQRQDGYHERPPGHRAPRDQHARDVADQLQRRDHRPALGLRHGRVHLGCAQRPRHHRRGHGDRQRDRRRVRVRGGRRGRVR
mmetsp:Transcript_19284/g.43737  ORF Transcript_19284/g.43737 Transcript_19284/m.43737 type:complete len:232 (+) Transcript_19284:168-863(+)